MLGQKIAELRQCRGWSRKALGDLIGVSDRSVQNWEEDVSDPTAEHIVKIVRLFGISSDWLLGIDSTFVINIGSLSPLHQRRLRMICQAYIGVPDD